MAACCLSEAECPAKMNVTEHVPTRKEGEKKTPREQAAWGRNTLYPQACPVLSSPPRQVGSIPVRWLLKSYSSSAWLLGQLLPGVFLALLGTVTPELGLENSVAGRLQSAHPQLA